MSDEGTIGKRYDRLAVDRQWYLTEAMRNAELTIPSIMASDQDASVIATLNSPEDLPKPWQSIGARGVRNLASKLGLALFPSTGPFMRYQLNPVISRELRKAELASKRTELERDLAIRESVIAEDVETKGSRTKIDQALRHLLVCGNVLVYLVPKGGIRIFPLNNYTVRRDFTGNVIELIYLEMLDKGTLPADLKQALIDGGHPCEPDGELSQHKDVETCKVYTRVMLKGDSFHVTREIDGAEVNMKGKNSIKKEHLPFLALRMVTIDGEDYGRAFVEEIRGDLRSAEELRKAIVIGSLNAAKVIALVQPGAAVTPKKLMEAPNGAAILGRQDDVVMLQQNKHGDFSVAQSTYQSLEINLSQSFLLNSSITRDAERVTAEEIRRMAEELEDALGGIYSVLSQELQLPLATHTERRLIKEKAIGELAEGTVTPVIVTGLAAIGRGHEYNRFREYLALVRDEIAPMVPDVAQFFIAREILERPAIGLGVTTEGLLKTDEVLQEEAAAAQQQQQQQQMMEMGGPAFAQVAAKEMGGKVTEQMGGEEQ
jgi:hypothetical protein